MQSFVLPLEYVYTHILLIFFSCFKYLLFCCRFQSPKIRGSSFRPSLPNKFYSSGHLWISVYSGSLWSSRLQYPCPGPICLKQWKRSWGLPEQMGNLAIVKLSPYKKSSTLGYDLNNTVVPSGVNYMVCTDNSRGRLVWDWTYFNKSSEILGKSTK